ncbi:MAG: hypothetical protein AB9891_15980 [Anaerolineaceae bacterium]
MFQFTFKRLITRIFKNNSLTLRTLLESEAEILEPVALGSTLPDVDGVIFPQMLGDAYRRLDQIKALPQPIMVVTSEFGTVSMWDWEINQYLSSNGVSILAPYNLESTLKACKAFALKRSLKTSKFLVFQDNPGEGFQAEIFKRFYWWEKECVDRISAQFGVSVDKMSFKAYGEVAKNIPDSEAEAAWQKWKEKQEIGAISKKSLFSAIKVYLMVKKELDKNPAYIGAGINCLNESHFSDSTPCLAWNMLYEDQRIVWGCEADIVSMVTKVLIDRILGVPFMMTNLYPFLMGMAVLKHEHIPNFPEVASEPENHILTAHCGYLGVLPKSFSTEWTLREKVLAIVDENATAIDARMQEGPITLVKVMPPFDQMSVVEGTLITYAGFPGSDCRNGAVIKVANGHRLMEELASHHYILTAGHIANQLETVAKVFGLKMHRIQ